VKKSSLGQIRDFPSLKVGVLFAAKYIREVAATLSTAIDPSPTPSAIIAAMRPEMPRRNWRTKILHVAFQQGRDEDVLGGESAGDAPMIRATTVC